MLEAHSPARIAHPDATWTVLDGNPVHEFVAAAAALCPPDLNVDVAINGKRQLTAVFAGRPTGSHRAACRFVERTSVLRVPRRFDVVVATNAGYPLDRNLYQAVKGMSAAARVVRPGGVIVIAAECRDGVPGEGRFGELLAGASSLDAMVSVPSGHDQWQVQVLGRVLQQARVAVFSEGLSEEVLRAAHMEPVGDISAYVSERLAEAGPGAGVCVLPYGPLTVATAPG